MMKLSPLQAVLRPQSSLSMQLAGALLLLAIPGTYAAPVSTLYLTRQGSSASQLATVGGGSNVVTPIGTHAYGTFEWPIAVAGDIRTLGYANVNALGGLYSLGGASSGTGYTATGIGNELLDATTDGLFNYLVDYASGAGRIIRTSRDYLNPLLLFSVPQAVAITYDPTNNSLWTSGWANDVVANYTMSGTLLSSFNTGHLVNTALALDHADGTLWLANRNTFRLEQYSKAGVLLSIGPAIGNQTFGGEFNYVGVPEPGSFLLAGSAALLLAIRRARRR